MYAGEEHNATAFPARCPCEDTTTNGNRLSRDLFGLFLIFLGLLLLLSLGTYDPRDPSMNHVVSAARVVSNKAGLFGSYVSGFLVDMLGVASFMAPGIFLIMGARRIFGVTAWPWWRWCGFAMMSMCIAVAGQAWKVKLLTVGTGGLMGHALLSFFSSYLGTVGTTLFWGFVCLFAVQLMTGFSWFALVLDCCAWLVAKTKTFAQEQAEARKLRAEEREEARLREQEREGENTQVREPVEAPPVVSTVVFSPRTDSAPPVSAPPISGKEDEFTFAPSANCAPGTDLGFLDEAIADEELPWIQAIEQGKIEERAIRTERERARLLLQEVQKETPDSRQFPDTSDTAEQSDPEEEKLPYIDIREAVETVPPTHEPERPKTKRAIPLPPFSLLHTVAEASQKTPREVLEAKGRTLMTCLSDFGVQGELVGIAPGPVVTMYEIRPAAGVRVARIENLNDDLALALKALAVRVQAPIPGTDTVGIEVPNENREMVCLKELFCSNAFAESESLLTMALGKDIQGAPTMTDLSRMPHLLVAGATGAGKSVCLNSILLSILYKARPEEVKLLLVDPKRVEMAVYADLPHLVHPVVTEMELAKNALSWAVAEMGRRYNDLALLGVRNITAYNAKIAELDRSRHPELAHLQFMPYLVIIIDELADLMMTAAKEVEGYIMRLAQLARAAGIHMILATQRPSVDVVTGLIKANFPCRISFQVTSKHDSRTILDTVGAEHLLGKGDMLYKPAGGRFRRLHGAFVRDDDVAAVVEYWRARQKPMYDVDFSNWGAESAQGGGGANGSGGEDIASDPMYAEAVIFVRDQGKASISLIQRRFRIGFNKAARFVEQMEQDGIIGPADGSKPRQVR